MQNAENDIFLLDLSDLLRVNLIGNITIRTPWSHFARTPDEYILFLNYWGDIYIEEDGRRYHLKRGDMLLLEPGRSHRGYESAHCGYYYLHFRLDSFKRAAAPDAFPQPHPRKPHEEDLYDRHGPKPFTPCRFPKFCHIDDNAEIFRLFESACSDFFRQRDNYSHLVQWKACEILLLIARDYKMKQIGEQDFCGSGIMRERGEELLDFLNNEYPNEITSAKLESLFSCNFDYLNRCFHAVTGQPIFRYLASFRIREAKRLIETTPLHMNEVGRLVGISDPYYFSRTFKKQTGMTPSEYKSGQLRYKKR